MPRLSPDDIARQLADIDDRIAEAIATRSGIEALPESLRDKRLIAAIDKADFFACVWQAESGLWDAIAIKCSDKVHALMAAGPIQMGPPPRFALITCRSADDAAQLRENYKFAQQLIADRNLGRASDRRSRRRAN